MMVSRLQFVRGSIAALSVAASPSESPPTLVRSASRAYEFAPQFPETPISPTFDQCEISRDGTLLISVFSTSRVIRLRGLEIAGDLRFPWYGSPDAIAHGPGVVYGVFPCGMGLPTTGGSTSIIRGNWKKKTFDVLKFPTGDLPGYLLPVGDSLFATNGAEIYKVAGTKNDGALYELLDRSDKTIVASETGYRALGKSDVLFYEVSTKRTLRSKSETLFDADAVKLRGGRSGCYTVSTKSGTTSIRRFSFDAGRIREGDVVKFESGDLVSEPRSMETIRSGSVERAFASASIRSVS